MTPDILDPIVRSGINRPGILGGIDCKFIPINDRWAVKVFNSWATCRDAHMMQARMAAYGLAPDVGGRFSLDEETHCYVTERVVPLLECVYGSDEWCDECDRLDRDNTIRLLVRDLKAKMKERGFDMKDGHAGNFGVRDGMLVCIDFGEVSW